MRGARPNMRLSRTKYFAGREFGRVQKRVHPELVKSILTADAASLISFVPNRSVKKREKLLTPFGASLTTLLAGRFFLNSDRAGGLILYRCIKLGPWPDATLPVSCRRFVGVLCMKRR